MGLKLKTIRRSHRPEKKFDAVFDKDGKEKIVSFGAAGMSNYTKHKNATRKQRYLTYRKRREMATTRHTWCIVTMDFME
jgi:hypothetical protein